MLRSFILLFAGLGLALTLTGVEAAPKHDPKHDKAAKHHADNSNMRIDLRGPSIDIGQVRLILGDNRSLLNPAKPLPPGIRKNLARGKPLPPGITKHFNNRLLEKLPHYEGYEWRQVGTDMVLVTLTTGLIYEVLDNVID